MAPKKKDVKADRGQQKAEEKAKQKIVEDKTFGLKNKNKSTKVQKYIQGVQQQVKGPIKGGTSAQIAKDQAAKESKKKQEQQMALLNSLFKGAENIKKIDVTDNKEAAKLTPLEIKESQKIDLYVDQREQKDNCEKWKIEQAQKTATEIVCKFFLDAVEKKHYGWFWNCPNGGDQCRYRHCLPPGYVLKDEAPVEDVKDEDTPLEEIIEQERAKLQGTLTPVTEETFKSWKKRREEMIAAEEAALLEASRKKIGRDMDILSGRDLFTFNPSLFIDDADAASDSDYDEDELDFDDDTEDRQEDKISSEDRVHQDDSCEIPSLNLSRGNAGAENEDTHNKRVDLISQVNQKELFLDDEELPDDLDDLEAVE